MSCLVIPFLAFTIAPEMSINPFYIVVLRLRPTDFSLTYLLKAALESPPPTSSENYVAGITVSGSLVCVAHFGFVFSSILLFHELLKLPMSQFGI